MVSGGLLWYHALIACIIGHGLGAGMTVWNGRGGSVYHIGFPIWMRATFGPRGAYIPVAIRCILDLVWFGIQTYFGGLFMDIIFQCVFGHGWTNIHNSLPASSETSSRAVSSTLPSNNYGYQTNTCTSSPHTSYTGSSSSSPASTDPTR